MDFEKFFYFVTDPVPSEAIRNSFKIPIDFSMKTMPNYWKCNDFFSSHFQFSMFLSSIWNWSSRWRLSFFLYSSGHNSSSHIKMLLKDIRFVCCFSVRLDFCSHEIRRRMTWKCQDKWIKIKSTEDEKREKKSDVLLRKWIVNSTS